MCCCKHTRTTGQGLDDDPTDLLRALRQMIVDDVYPDGRAFSDGHGECQIGDPDEDVAGNLLRPYGGAGTGHKFCDDVAVNHLPGDEQDDAEQAADHENAFKVLV